jgi:hypothetical protein
MASCAGLVNPLVGDRARRIPKIKIRLQRIYIENQAT